MRGRIVRVPVPDGPGSRLVEEVLHGPGPVGAHGGGHVDRRRCLARDAQCRRIGLRRLGELDDEREIRDGVGDGCVGRVVHVVIVDREGVRAGRDAAIVDRQMRHRAAGLLAVDRAHVLIADHHEAPVVLRGEEQLAGAAPPGSVRDRSHSGLGAGGRTRIVDVELPRGQIRDVVDRDVQFDRRGRVRGLLDRDRCRRRLKRCGRPSAGAQHHSNDGEACQQGRPPQCPLCLRQHHTSS